MSAPQKHEEHREDRDRPSLATFVGVLAGSQLGIGSAFVWWQAIIEVVLGFGLHFWIYKQRNHAGTMLIAFVASGLVGIAAGSFGVWLRS